MKTLTPGLLFLAVGLLAGGCDSAASRTTGQANPSSNGEVAKAPEKKPIIWPKNPAIGSLETESPDGAAIDSKSVKPPRKEDEEEPNIVVQPKEPEEVPPEKDPPIPDTYKPLNKEKTLFFEKTKDDKRRVHILAEVCLREGPLEVLLCRKNTKEHESILDADLDARDIHFALIAAGAKPGTTVRFVPKYRPATGDTIKVSVTYHLGGKLQTRPAQQWIRSIQTKKDMEHDWVFAGSRFFKDPEEPQKPPFYCANNGEVICIANFADSMMDLPVKSSKEQAELGFQAHTERIPPLKTKVIVTLEPVKK